MKFRRFIAALIVAQVILLFIKFDFNLLALILWEIGWIFQNKKLEDKDRKIDLLEREKLNYLTKNKK